MWKASNIIAISSVRFVACRKQQIRFVSRARGTEKRKTGTGCILYFVSVFHPSLPPFHRFSITHPTVLMRMLSLSFRWIALATPVVCWIFIARISLTKFIVFGWQSLLMQGNFDTYCAHNCKCLSKKGEIYLKFWTYRVFSLTWPASMQIYWNKRKSLHKKRVQLPEDWFGTPMWPPWRHVKTLYCRPM